MKTNRILNMEEKRKLEKLIFADIEKARREYESKMYQKINDYKITDTKALALLETYKSLEREQEATEKTLEKMGYDINHYCYNKIDEWNITVDDDNKQPALKKMKDEKEANLKRIDELKRSYTLKLFAGGDEALEVFTQLAKDLAKIIA